jgi:hypothetical protein
MRPLSCLLRICISGIDPRDPTILPMSSKFIEITISPKLLPYCVSIHRREDGQSNPLFMDLFVLVELKPHLSR